MRACLRTRAASPSRAWCATEDRTRYLSNATPDTNLPASTPGSSSRRRPRGQPSQHGADERSVRVAACAERADGAHRPSLCQQHHGAARQGARRAVGGVRSGRHAKRHRLQGRGTSTKPGKGEGVIRLETRCARPRAAAAVAHATLQGGADGLLFALALALALASAVRLSLSLSLSLSLACGPSARGPLPAPHCASCIFAAPSVFPRMA